MLGFQYNSDFSEAPTLPDSDSDEEPSSPELVARIQGTVGALRIYLQAVSYGIAPDVIATLISLT